MLRPTAQYSALLFPAQVVSLDALQATTRMTSLLSLPWAIWMPRPLPRSHLLSFRPLWTRTRSAQRQHLKACTGAECACSECMPWLRFVTKRRPGPHVLLCIVNSAMAASGKAVWDDKLRDVTVSPRCMWMQEKRHHSRAATGRRRRRRTFRRMAQWNRPASTTWYRRAFRSSHFTPHCRLACAHELTLCACNNALSW